MFLLIHLEWIPVICVRELYIPRGFYSYQSQFETRFQPTVPLHSTMFLLIPLSLFMQHIHDLSLHSTMFLLILIAVKLLLGLQAFTFHDVSINTDTTQSRKDSVLNFTFHDVSINTRCLFILTIQI